MGTVHSRPRRIYGTSNFAHEWAKLVENIYQKDIMNLMVNKANEIRKMNLNINNIQKNQIINNEYITDTYLKNQFILFENIKKTNMI